MLAFLILIFFNEGIPLPQISVPQIQTEFWFFFFCSLSYLSKSRFWRVLEERQLGLCAGFYLILLFVTLNLTLWLIFLNQSHLSSFIFRVYIFLYSTKGE